MDSKKIKFAVLWVILFSGIFSQSAMAQKAAVEFISRITPPKVRNQVELTDGIRRLTLKGKYLYIGNVWGGLQVVDVSDVHAPSSVAYLTFPDEVKGSFIQDGYLYLANHGEGVAILQMNADGQLKKLAQVKTAGAVEWVQGENPYLYVALGKDGFAIMDISDLENPLTLSLEIPGTWVQHLVKQGNYLYVSAKKDGFFIYDVTQKDQPVKLHQFKTGYSTFMAQIDGNLAYLADGAGGLLIMDVTNPKFPVEISRLPIKGIIHRLFKSGNYVYLCDRDYGLRIVNVSDPRQPYLEGEYVTESTCYDVLKRDIYVYLATNTATLIMRHNNAPILQKIGDLTLNEGQPFTLHLQYQEPDGDSVYFEAKNIPPGSTFDREKGIFTWQPDYEASGTYPNVVFSVIENTESRLSDSDTLSITVQHVNRLPDLPALSDTTILENTPLVITIPAGTDPDKEDRNHLTYRAEKLPPGASFDPHTRQFSWTPTYDQSGIYVVDFILDDGAGGIDREPMTITVQHVDRPPKITALKDTTINEGDTLQIQLSGVEPDKEDRDKIVFTMKNLPEGATFDPASHTFRWIPSYDQSGVYPGIVAKMQAGALSDSTSFTITVNHVNRPPVLQAIGDRAINENQLLSFKIKGTDPDKEDQGKLTYVAENLPMGATFNPDSLVFRWKPTFDQAGKYPDVTFRVQDPGGLSDEEKITITVNNVNRPPVITPVAEYSIKENEPLKIQIHASDPDKEDVNKLRFSATPLPEGAQINQTTGLFTWTPTFEQAGEYQITFSVTDGQYTDTTTSRIIVEQVNRPPVLNPIENPTVKENQELILPISGSDPDKEDAGKLKFYVKNLPAGARFDSTNNQIVWKPSFEDAGTYPITIGIEDPQGARDEKIIQVTVENVNRPPTVEVQNQYEVSENQPLNIKFKVADPDSEDQGKLTLTVTPLPQGAKLLPRQNTLTWTPTFEQSGEYTLTVRVTDPEGLFSEKQFKIVVNNVDRPPALGKISPLEAEENKDFQFEIPVTDPDTEDVARLIITLTNLPPGATFDKATHLLKWKPTFEQAGEYTITVSVTDPGGLSATGTIPIRVKNFNRPPVVKLPDSITVRVGEKITVKIEASDPDPEDQNQLKIEVKNLPGNAKFDAARGFIEWTPQEKQTGEYKIKVEVMDPHEAKTEKTLTIRIQPKTTEKQLQKTPPKK